MFPVVKRYGATVTVGAALAVAALAPPALAAAPPTRAQIQAAVKRALHSHEIWSTVNICDTKHHPNTIGIRGQMPSLSFPSNMFMDVQVDYWSSKHKRFEPDPGVKELVSLGDPVNRIVQGGAMFKFKPSAILSGTVTFEWKLDGKLIASKRRATGGGHKDAEYGDPPGYSSVDCYIN
jgi:hypothetical protein